MKEKFTVPKVDIQYYFLGIFLLIERYDVPEGEERKILKPWCRRLFRIKRTNMPKTMSQKELLFSLIEQAEGLNRFAKAERMLSIRNFANFEISTGEISEEDYHEIVEATRRAERSV